MSIVTRDTFTGSNNIAKPERLPEGAVVDALNMDFTVGGKAELRTGFSKIRDGSNIRGLFTLGEHLVVVDGGSVFLRKDEVEHQVASVPLGPIAATECNGALYLNTLTSSLVITPRDVHPWAVHEPTFDVAVVSGSMEPGLYKVGVTLTIDGRESGCLPAVVRIGEGQAISVRCASSGDLRLYCSVANGLTMYSQGRAHPVNIVSSPLDDTARLETAFLTSLPFCERLISHDGLIIGSNGRFLYHTKPMHAHLHNAESDYLQFPAPITVIASVEGGVYVCADKTYFISNIGGQDMQQKTVTEFGAVPGTSVTLPDGKAAWFSEYGQVIAGPDGEAEFVNKGSYSPHITEGGASGFLEHNGNQMIVTTMRGEQKGSCLKSVDHWDIEVI